MGDWNKDRASDHIDRKLKEVETVSIVDYTRDKTLESIPVNKAYKVAGAHLYMDILNLDDMLGVTDAEGVTCHRRTLRFLNQHFRAVDRILDRCEIRRVDFHNQRLGWSSSPMARTPRRRACTGLWPRPSWPSRCSRKPATTTSRSRTPRSVSESTPERRWR
jgi:hypothetical protein